MQQNEESLAQKIERLAEEICDFHVERCLRDYQERYNEEDEALEHMKDELCSRCPVCRL